MDLVETTYLVQEVLVLYTKEYFQRRNVAIKLFNLQIDGAFRSFDVECEVMSNILHRNLVKVITCCFTIDFKALVLEFMPNGSLEKWLYSNNYVLDILQKINIMIDVALALEYLHLGYSFLVIHCDLKPSNVLLDKDMVAHVGDFGIAKLLGEGDSIKQTMIFATIGYMAPDNFLFIHIFIFFSILTLAHISNFSILLMINDISMV